MKNIAANFTHADGRARTMMYPIDAIVKQKTRITPRFFKRSEIYPARTTAKAVAIQTGTVSRFAWRVEKPKLFTKIGKKFPNAARLMLVMQKASAGFQFSIPIRKGAIFRAYCITTPDSQGTLSSFGNLGSWYRSPHCMLLGTCGG